MIKYRYRNGGIDIAAVLPNGRTACYYEAGSFDCDRAPDTIGEYYNNDPPFEHVDDHGIWRDTREEALRDGRPTPLTLNREAFQHHARALKKYEV